MVRRSYVFVDQEKAYDRVPREELWYCTRMLNMELPDKKKRGSP